MRGIEAIKYEVIMPTKTPTGDAPGTAIQRTAERCAAVVAKYGGEAPADLNLLADIADALGVDIGVTLAPRQTQGGNQ